MNPDDERSERRGGFPPTRRSLVQALREGAPSERRPAFDAVVRAYWRPVYKYLRLRHGRGNEDAEDLTQGFFAYALEKDFLAGFDPARARFRTWLRLGLDRFARNEARARRTAKRGGGAPALGLDFAAAEGELRREEPVAPEAGADFFEMEWRRALFAAALAALARSCRAAGRPERYELFVRHDLAAEGKRPAYADLAATLGLDLTAVTNGLHAARRTFRRLVLEQLREQTDGDAELQEELRNLLRVHP